MAKLSDYPFSERHEGCPERFHGIHKCRAFRDPEMRWLVFQTQCRAAGEPIELDGTEPKTPLERETADRNAADAAARKGQRDE